MVSTIWASLIAVFAALAGSTLNALLTRWATARSEQAARRDRARTDQAAACLAFAQALAQLRTTAAPVGENDTGESFGQACTAAQHALLRLRLCTPDQPDLITLGQVALRAATAAGHPDHTAHTTHAVEQAGRHADAFIAHAAAVLH